jgi:hypothetical protein
MRTVPQVLNFSVAYDSVLHGLGGYFECTLYKDIMLSILPATHSPGNPINVFAVVLISVGDPDPQDPRVFEPSGSGSFHIQPRHSSSIHPDDAQELMFSLQF